MSQPRGIVLVGAAGSGKSTVGTALATALVCPILETDEAVAERVGRSSGDYLLTAGEGEFRKVERDVAEELLDRVSQQPCVLALGGGLPADEAIRARLAAEDFGPLVVWLRVTAPNAISRVGLNAPRPVALGNVRAQLTALMTAMEPHYREVADVSIDTDHRDPADLASEILRDAGIPGSGEARAREDRAEASGKEART